MPDEGGQGAAVDPRQAANHFFVFLQALIFLGQLWDGIEGWRGSKKRRVEGFLEKQIQMDMSLPASRLALSPVPGDPSGWGVLGRGCPIPQESLRDSGGRVVKFLVAPCLP